MIEQVKGLIDAPPLMVVNEKVTRECGCGVYLGWRVDNQEAATCSWCCGPEHAPLIHRFNDLLKWSLVDGGTDRPMADVCDELLNEASRILEVS